MLERHSAQSACQRLAAFIDHYTGGRGDGVHLTPLHQLNFLRESAAPVALSDVYEPTLVIVVQGEKVASLGEEHYRYRAAQYLVIAVDLPISGLIVEATPTNPYLAFLLKLDLSQLTEVFAEVQLEKTQTPSLRGLFVSDAEVPLIDCALRLAQLLETPQDAAFLAPLLIRELYYRLLTGRQSEVVRQIATSGSATQRIAEVIKVIKKEISTPLRVKDLAEQAHMSPASFYRHFKDVTSMSPLHFQKQLRLLEARRLMLAERANAAHAAYQVGYESPSQFSREYSRMFGAPPLRDVERLRSV